MTAARAADAEDYDGISSQSPIGTAPQQLGPVSGAIGLCIADLIGVGGTQGLTGDGTGRIKAFAALGKGRKQAYDGPAWTAAIEDAIHRLAGKAAGMAEYTLILGADGGDVYLAIHVCEECLTYEFLGEIGLGIEPAWLRSITGNVLLALGRGEETVTVGKRTTVRIEGTPADWGKVFNGVADAR